ncbi:LysR family transcriptional regulator [Shewanella surugensis]|uniref:LysR family transcriptional regulator n=1 Tax=Shewanella surugensis TaxID=212020 RepID=A0ABT0L5X0_9GAMM|nr:LysR family transcriptional regulator [Shewanella surugensis]MCL1122964.1 LysR family transcriptional regulator [Shewanella surugensis]
MSGINRLELKQLRLLEALLVQKNVSKVAAKMGLTQQAVSEQLKKMRDIFNDELFIRSSYGVIPTVKAEALAEPIQQILSQVEALFEQAIFDASKLDQVFTISSSDYAMLVILPDLLSHIALLAPRLKIIVREFESDNLEALMASGAIDLALTFPEFIPNNLLSETLFTERHVCVCASNSTLANKTLSLKQLALLPQIIVSPSRANLKGSHDLWFSKRGLKRNIVMSLPSFSAVLACVGATDRVAFIPARLLPNEQVSVIHLEENPPSFEVIQAWHQRSKRDPVLKWMLAKMREAIEAH